MLKMSIFKWTSPVRRGNLSPIPNEVYIEIFNYLRPPDSKPWIDPVYRRDFSRIALVCRFFCSVMLPWIFESIEFAGKNPNGSLSLNHAPFCRSIIHGSGSAQTMATYVKRCSFSDWILDQNDTPSSWCNKEFQTLYSRALALMPNVEELKLTRIYINKHLLKSIMELKCLTSLSLDRCLVRKAKDIRKLSTLRLKYLRLFGSPGPSRILVDDDTLLISQSLCLDSLLMVHTNCWSFVTRIAEQDCHLLLRELDIVEAHDVRLLPKIFQKTPALKKLRISSAVTSQQEIQFDNVLPVLDELCCPLFLLRSLVPGRPISSIEIAAISLTEKIDIQSVLKKSTCRIRSLCVPIRNYKIIPFWQGFSDLESLRLEFAATQFPCPLTEESLKKCLSYISNWPHYPPIQELHLDLVFGRMDPFFDLELQNKIISTTISPRFPHLRCVSISDYLVWNKVYGDDVWKPSLHRIPLLLVAKRLRSGEVNPVDYDGFFERILSTAEEFW
ncbi:hypothetical protein BYT27DRAFT_7169820 [Phlegmacium glaucopus]|nr:hypothetical protein BYT27DRAFT_7169820 [Phlegmacium glaucopus]